jgi:hypothetical protein
MAVASTCRADANSGPLAPTAHRGPSPAQVMPLSIRPAASWRAPRLAHPDAFELGKAAACHWRRVAQMSSIASMALPSTELRRRNSGGDRRISHHGRLAASASSLAIWAPLHNDLAGWSLGPGCPPRHRLSATIRRHLPRIGPHRSKSPSAAAARDRTTCAVADFESSGMKRDKIARTLRMRRRRRSSQHVESRTRCRSPQCRAAGSDESAVRNRSFLPSLATEIMEIRSSAAPTARSRRSCEELPHQRVIALGVDRRVGRRPSSRVVRTRA